MRATFFASVDTAYLSADCHGQFNVSIVRLEYINEVRPDPPDSPDSTR